MVMIWRLFSMYVTLHYDCPYVAGLSSSSLPVTLKGLNGQEKERTNMSDINMSLLSKGPAAYSSSTQTGAVLFHHKLYLPGN